MIGSAIIKVRSLKLRAIIVLPHFVSFQALDSAEAEGKTVAEAAEAYAREVTGQTS